MYCINLFLSWFLSVICGRFSDRSNTMMVYVADLCLSFSHFQSRTMIKKVKKGRLLWPE